MAGDFLGSFIGNPARAKVARVFIFSESEPLTAAQAARRASVSPRRAEREIRALEVLGILKRGKGRPSLKNTRKTSKKRGAKQKPESAWILNIEFKYVPPLSKFVHEVSPVRYGSILDALKSSGKLVAVIVSGSFMGDPSRPADLIVAADGLNEKRLEQAIRALEPKFGREIRYAAFSTPEFRYRLTIHDRLLRDTLDYPHVVLLDRARLL